MFEGQGRLSMGVVLLLVGAGFLTGCGEGEPEGMAGGFPVSAVVAKAERELVEDQVVVVGSLDARNEVTIVSELDATVTEILFKEGQSVSKGDILFRLDGVRTGAQLEQAQAFFRLAELTYERNKELFENNTISKEKFGQAKADYHDRKAALALAQDEQDNTVIEAPFTGLVGERNVSVGQYVSRGKELAELVSTDPLEIVFDVPERRLGKLRNDLSVAFAADAYPEETFSGLVVYVAPLVNERTRTVHVKAEVSNESGRLKPGMFGVLTLVLEERENALVIPEACIQFTGDTTSIVIVNHAGLSEIRPVQVGNRFKGRVEIVDGVTEGEIVVVEGFQKMGPGAQIIAAAESAEYGVSPGPLGEASKASPATARKAEEEDVAPL